MADQKVNIMGEDAFFDMLDDPGQVRRGKVALLFLKRGKEGLGQLLVYFEKFHSGTWREGALRL
jgi:hypothetical protein